MNEEQVIWLCSGLQEIATQLARIATALESSAVEGGLDRIADVVEAGVSVSTSDYGLDRIADAIGRLPR
jgi:uncharacterized metal-binding protein